MSVTTERVAHATGASYKATVQNMRSQRQLSRYLCIKELGHYSGSNLNTQISPEFFYWIINTFLYYNYLYFLKIGNIIKPIFKSQDDKFEVSDFKVVRTANCVRIKCDSSR